MSDKYFVRLHGDHGFTPGAACTSLSDAEAAARKALESNPYFRGATIHYRREQVTAISPPSRFTVVVANADQTILDA